MSERTENPPPTRMLEGTRVLDFTQYLAGPTCTRLLVELGAEVIKVEFPPEGDPTRVMEPARGGMSGLFTQQNRGKLSLAIDLRHGEATALVERLIPSVDIVVENFTPGVLAKRGLGYEDLDAINPRIIMASVSGFGQEGSYAHRTCYDFIAQAMAGHMHMTGDPDGPPYFVGIGSGDVTAGVHAFAGLGYALYQRERTGRGTHVDVSMVDALFHMQEYAVGAASMTGGEFVPMRQGRNYQPVAPAGTFKAPEGWIVIICMPNQMDALWAAIGDADLAADPRFADPAARVEHRAALTEVIEAWMATFPDDVAVLARLEEHRVPAGPVLSPAAAIDHPWFRERGGVRDVRDADGGTFVIPGFPIRFGGEKPDRDVAPAAVGAHTRAVLTDAGITTDEIDDLIDRGVLLA